MRAAIRHRAAWTLTAVAMTLGGHLALASDDEQRARQLFVEGHEAADRGDHATACAKFEDSLRLFRRASTLLNLGECSEKLGRLAAALRYWREGAATLEPGDPRMPLATQRLADLDARVPRLAVVVPQELPPGAAVTADDEPLGRQALAEPLRLDPGEHRLALQAPGRERVEQRVKLAEGEHADLELRLGAALAEEGAAPAVPAEQEGSAGLRIAGYSIGALGIGAVVAGAITGGLVLDRKAMVEEYCVEDQCTDARGIDAASEGRDLGIASTVTFALGAAALGTGLALVLAAEVSETADEPPVGIAFTVTPRDGGMWLQGRF